MVELSGGSNPNSRQVLKAGSVPIGFSIAIDRGTGEALLLFKPSNRDTVKDVADVYHLFEIELTARQRTELAGSLDDYERIPEERTG